MMPIGPSTSGTLTKAKTFPAIGRESLDRRGSNTGSNPSKVKAYHWVGLLKKRPVARTGLSEGA